MALEIYIQENANKRACIQERIQHLHCKFWVKQKKGLGCVQLQHAVQ